MRFGRGRDAGARARGGRGRRRSAAPTTPLTSDLSSKIPPRPPETEAGDGLQLPSDLLSPAAFPRPAGAAACAGVWMCVCAGLCPLHRPPSPPPGALSSPGGAGTRARRAGAAYRGATPRGARESTTRCRGRRRRGRPGSHPAVPRSCGGKENVSGCVSLPPSPLAGPSPCYRLATDTGSPLCDRSQRQSLKPAWLSHC